jgi:nickel/cobalt transporter (NicO) family protein
MEFLVAIQRWIHDILTADISAFAATRQWGALVGLIPLGVLFGAFHALTPGHGKTVLASYLAGSRLTVARGLGVAGVQALTHVSSAVLIALLAIPLVTKTLGGAGRAPALELLSRGLLAAIGGWLLWRAIRGRPHNHDETTGLSVGVIAGLVPCPLTLFAMVFALANGVPAAGIAFALAMLIGVALTLCVVAALTVLAREWLIQSWARHGASITSLSRLLEGATGVALLSIGLAQLASISFV